MLSFIYSENPGHCLESSRITLTLDQAEDAIRSYRHTNKQTKCHRGKYVGSALRKTEKSTTAAGDDTTQMKDYIYDNLLKKSLFNQPATFLE